MGIKYEDIKKANDSIVTTPIERKDKDGNLVVKNYADVNQRIKAFRMIYPDGFIIPEMVSNENGVCVFKAMVGYHDDGEPKVLGIGTAYEKENSTFINKTSYIENCETSAVGRALGMAGFGIDTSVASYEEVANAIQNQGERKASEKQLELIRKYFEPERLEKLMTHYKIEKLEDLALKDASDVISKMKGEMK